MTAILALRRGALAPEWMLLAVAAVWGSSYGVAKGALAHAPVLLFLLIRFGLTALLLLPRAWTLAPRQRRASGVAAWPLGLVLLAIFLCETWGVAWAGAVDAAFLVCCCVVFTPLMEWRMLGRRPARGTWALVGLSLAGAALLTGGARLEAGAGQGLLLLAAVLRAWMVCLARQRLAPAAVDPLLVTGLQALVVALGCGLLLALEGPAGWPAWPLATGFWLSTAYLVVFATIFAFHAQNLAIRACPPTRVGLLLGSEPLFGAAFGWLWLGEQPGAAGWLGGALMVAASLLALRGGQR